MQNKTSIPISRHIKVKAIAGVFMAISVGLSTQPILAIDQTAKNTVVADECTAPQQTFGRMFTTLPAAAWSNADLDKLTAIIMAEHEDNPTPENERDDEENINIDAGYTYVGQFIDHDITLDERTNDLTTPTDPNTLKNLRTPQFDLDSVYGKGPTQSPELYEADGLHLKLGRKLNGSPDQNAVDLPRKANGQALLGDPRNDENVIVAQLHTLVLRFHNQTADQIKRQNPGLSESQIFERARQLVIWHYQWAVINDFLPRIVGPRTTNDVINRTTTQWNTNLRFYTPCANMPVEFSVAAYRFGHSMVRALYRINPLVERLPVFTPNHALGTDLTGFGPPPENFAIDWKFFFQMRPERAINMPQASYKLDNSLTFALSQLPLPAIGTGPASLAKRNLMRGVQMGLPSGQDVARAMGIAPLRDDQILIGKATGDRAVAANDAVLITSISPAFAGKTPLWVYIFAEATARAYNIRNGDIQGDQRAPFLLGPVGGRIVAETFVGLMKSDPNSILNQPNFRPNPRFLGRNGEFGFKELVRVVTEPPTNIPPPPPQSPPPPPPNGGPRRPPPPR
jgi:hypothetical protein